MIHNNATTLLFFPIGCYHQEARCYAFFSLNIVFHQHMFLFLDQAIFAQPLPSLLLRLDTAHKKLERAWMRRGRVDIIYCGQLDIEEELHELCKGIEGALLRFLRNPR